MSGTPPGPSWLAPTLRPYRREWIRFDVIAGVAAGAVVIPQAMAYATIAGLPVAVGLYTCMVPMLVYALVGGSRSLSISTTSTIAVLTAATIGGLSGHRSDADLMRDAFTLSVLVGLILLVMRLFRLGSIIELVSPATMTGIKAGVGLTVAASQLPALLGTGEDLQGEGFFAKVADVAADLADVSAVTATVSVVAIAVLLLLRRFAPGVPGPLVVTAGAIALVAFTDVEDRGLALIPHVPDGLPTPAMPMWGDVIALLPGALAIALMAFLETLLVARAQRQRSEPQIDSQQELLATGLTSLVGGLFQAMPPAGGFSQSAVNQRAGARSQVSGVVTAMLAVVVALVLGPVLEDLPEAILAAVVMVAVLGLISPREFVRLLRIDRAEFWVAVVTAMAGLTVGLLVGVAVGVGLTLMLVLRDLSRSQVSSGPDERSGDDLVLRLDGSIFTGNARVTQDDVVGRALATPGVGRVVLDVSAVRQVTVPFLDMLEAVSEDLGHQGTELVVASPSTRVLEAARRTAWFAAFEQAGHVQVDGD